jgi:autotransporter-associated beta strand protein
MAAAPAVGWTADPSVFPRSEAREKQPRSRQHQMNAPRKIGEIPGCSRFVASSSRSANDGMIQATESELASRDLFASLSISLAFASNSYKSWIKRSAAFILLTVVCQVPVTADAGDATWLSSPGSGNWNTDANWAPGVVPTGTAAFGASDTTTVTFSKSASVDGLQFNPGAPAYSFKLSGFSLTVEGTGIVNQSSNAPIFLISSSSPPAGILVFKGVSTAGNSIITNGSGGNTRFQDTSTAGTATITTNAGGTTRFYDKSSGGDARFITNAGGKVDISTLFAGATTAGSIEGAGSYLLGKKRLTVGLNNLSTEVSGTIADGGAGSGQGGSLIKVGTGTLTLSGTNTYTGGTTIRAGTLQLGSVTETGSILGPVVNSSTFTVFNADTSGITSITNNAGGITRFQNSSTAGSATIITNSGGSTRFYDESSGGNARFVTNAGGKVDISTLFIGATTAGSIEGAGSYLLGSKKFTVGLNNLSTEVSGTITDGGAGGGKGGSLVKEGTGTLTLSGADTYTGGTTISAGTLQLGSSTKAGSIVGPVVNDSTFTVFNANTSGITSITTNGGGDTRFQNTSTAGKTIITTNSGGTTRFYDESSGGKARFITNAGGNVDISTLFVGAITAGSIEGAGSYLLGKKRLTVGLNNLSTEVSGTIADGGAGSGQGGSLIKVGRGTLTLSGADTYTGGTTISAGRLLLGTSTRIGSILGPVVNSGTFTLFNADTSGITSITTNGGGVTRFQNSSTAGTAIITTNSGGTTRFYDKSTGGDARFITNAGGRVDISTLFTGATTAGSIEGAGSYLLGKKRFTVGLNDLSTEVSGTIADGGAGSGQGGSLIKVGTGTLTLSGADTYTGGTTILAGTLKLGSGTGAGSIVGAVINSSTFDLFNSSGAGIISVINKSGAETVFENASLAGSATVTNQGGGQTLFKNLSSADSAAITSQSGGQTVFENTSSGGNAAITNQSGGQTVFENTSSAGNATVTNQSGGQTLFENTSTAGTANIVTNLGGSTRFYNESSGGSARLVTELGGVVDISSLFAAGMTAGSIEGAGTYLLGSKKLTVGLNNLSTEMSGTIADGGAGGGARGVLIKTGTGTLTLSGNNTYTGGTTILAGTLQLGAVSTTGSIIGTVVNSGTFDIFNANATQITNITNNPGGRTLFENTSTAGTTTVTNQGGITQFLNTSTADNARISNLSGGSTQFADTSSAGIAGISNNGGATIFSGHSTAADSNLSISNGGLVEFDNSSTAAHSTIAITVNGGIINFAGSSTAANSTIITGEGATQFLNTSTAGNATLITRAFGSIGFFDNSTGGQARFVTDEGGIFDISFLAAGGMTAGSIEGGGAYHLGSKALTVGLNNLSSLVSGSINDGGRNGGTGAVLTKVGSGTLTLTGPNTYSGGTNLDGGIVAVNSDDNLGTGPLSFDGGKLQALAPGKGFTTSKTIFLNDGGGTFSADAGTTSRFSAAISGTGSLTKEGQGTLALSGANAYSGGTVIDLGTLMVDSPQALGTGDVFVRGGVLTADPQSINVAGNYTQSGAGTLQLQVAGANPGQYDSLNVSGNAALGGTLQLISLGFEPKAGNQLTLVTAGGLLSGRFASFVDPFTPGSGFSTVSLVYGRNSVLLNFLNEAHPMAQFIVTTNFSSFVVAPTEVPAANLLNAVQSDPKAVGLISFVNNEPFANLPVDFEKISPEALSAFYEIGFSNANIQRLNLESRLDDLRSGSNGFSSNMKVNGATVNLQAGSSADGKSSKSVVEPVLQHTPENHWGVWATGFGDFVSVDSDGGAQGYNFTTGGVSLGLDYRITDSLAIGVMGDYSHTWTSLQPSGHIDVDSGRGGLYATWYSHGFYLNGAIYGGHNNYDSSRAGLGGLATGGTEGSEWSTFASGGYDFHFGALTAGPLASLQYTSVHIDGFSEKGSLAPLAIHSDSAESLRSDVGFRLFYPWQIGKVVLEPSLKAAWEHEYKYSALPITAGFAGIPGPSSTFSGPSEGHDSAVVSAGISVQWTPAIATYVNYDGQLGRDNYSSNAVTGGIRIGF